MDVTKPIDIALLSTELARAGQPAEHGLFYAPTGTNGEGILLAFDDAGQTAELPPEAAPVVDAHDASKPKRAQAFEGQEDAERRALVAERSQADPAFAALAELTLGKQGG